MKEDIAILQDLVEWWDHDGPLDEQAMVDLETIVERARVSLNFHADNAVAIEHFSKTFKSARDH